MLKRIEHLARAGFAIHWLHPNSKRPIGKDWADRPVMDVEGLRKSYKEGRNVGVRLGTWSLVRNLFLHAIDMDVRDQSKADEALAKLKALFPTINFTTVPTVISGSGGASRHFYILTDCAFASKKLAHSEGFTMVLDATTEKEVKKWDFEIELFGTGKQVALPPSIHPDTGNPYRWIQRRPAFACGPAANRVGRCRAGCSGSSGRRAGQRYNRDCRARARAVSRIRWHLARAQG